MSTDFVVHAEARTLQGKGASRRLRKQNKVPAILYGGHKEPTMLQVEHHKLSHHLENEAFYSHILNIETPDGTEQAVLKDLQRHPAKALILHVDFMRIVAGEAIKMHVPLHFVGEEACPGIKAGGVLDKMAIDVEVQCMPRHLPEYIEVDISNLEMDTPLHLSDISVSDDIELTTLAHGDDATIAVIHQPRAEKAEDDIEDAADDAGEEAESDSED